MRALAAMCVVLLLAGCASQAPSSTPSNVTPSATPSAPSAQPNGGVSAATPEPKAFCAQQAGCTFWDEDFHEYVLYNVDTANVNVLIVPSASPNGAHDTLIMKLAAQRWAEGIRTLGQPWFAIAFQMHVYVLGTDTPPQDAIEHPTIIILAAEYNPALLFGIGLEPKQTACGTLGQGTNVEYPAHAHDGFEVRASDCTGAGFVCMTINTNFLLGSDIQMVDLVAHEFGHCLGGGHVGDALDFNAKRVPVQDIMSYQHDDAQAHCVSNLNVRVLENLYAPILGRAPDAPLRAGDSYPMPSSSYQHVACANPA